MIDECTPGRLLKKAAAYSTDNGNKHIQGAEFKMTYLGKENAFFFAPAITINLGLMGNAVCTFKYTILHKHPIMHTQMHTCSPFALLEDYSSFLLLQSATP